MVFKTIADNVKSFFLKEDELEREPKKAPDAAVELFEKPASHAIVSHNLKGPLPTSERPKPATQPLPFSAAQLRERLGQQEQRPAQPSFSAAQPQPPQPSQQAFPVPARQPAKPLITEEDISSQIAEFEQAINSIPGEDGSRLPLSMASVHAAVPSSPAASPKRGLRLDEGFFAEFERYLRDKGYDVDESLLSDEVLVRMRLHHAHRLEHDKHHERSEALEEALGRKLAELQALERDWTAHQEEVMVANDRIDELEEEIAKRTAELRELVSSFKAHASSEPEQLVPALPETTPPSVSSPVALPSIVPPSSLTPLSGPASAPSTSPTISSPSTSSSSPSPVPDLSVPSSSSPSPAPSSPVPSSPTAETETSPSPVSSAQPAPDERFFLADGRALASLAELRDALPSMDDTVFHHHVRPERNDFANWIRGVFKDERLAAWAERARNKYELAALLSAG